MQLAARPIRNRNNTPTSTPLLRRRFWFICLFFLFWVGIICTRLFWLQVVRHKEFVERAQKQQERTFEVAPRRGVLYDRNLHELAMTVQVDSIYAVPSEIDDKDKKNLAHLLAEIVHVDPNDNQTSEDQLFARLDAGRGFAWIARRVSEQASQQIHDLLKQHPTIKGIYFQKEFQRFYPNNEIAAQILGYVGVDDNGLGGIEQKFDAKLHGVPGKMFTALDARRHVLGSSESEPQPGQNMVLTIDENIQFLAERALDHAMERTQAANGTVVIQDVHTGQILALAVRPTFNPNNARRTTPELLRNHAVSDVYEPGSTFKLIAYSAALDQRAVTPDDIVDCQGGQITIAGRVIHDDKSDRGLGKITVTQALAHSSDVGAIKMALKVGNNTFYKYIRDFGFGARSGIELPGETRGLLRPVERWDPASIGSLAIGQEVGVTPVQLVTMVSTIANGGVYLPPHILMSPHTDQHGSELQAQPFKPGADLPNPLPQGSRRVISEMAAAQMRKMLESVVLFGTGRSAQLNGYTSAGKTGTAQKIDPTTHTYSKSMHIASFAGFAPVNNPVISVAIVMDSPKGSYYGAAVSAPIFSEVAQQVLEYLGVQHDTELRASRTPAKPIKVISEDEEAGQAGDINALYAAVNDLPSDDPLRQPQQSAPNPSEVQTAPIQPAHTTMQQQAASAPSPQIPRPPSTTPPQPAEITVSDARQLKVPQLVGLPIRKVIEQAAAAGLEVQIVGSGNAREQAPAAGTVVRAGTKIIVRCGR